MVRAATVGAIDFAKFDPHDSKWWRKLEFVLHELHMQDRKHVTEVQHRHWSTLSTVPDLTPEAWENARTNARQQLGSLLELYYPWMKGTTDVAASQRDTALKEYRAVWGYPGEPKYEAMLKQQAEAWRKINAGWKKKGLLQEGEE